MDILFIRHGETDWNREMRIQGGIVEIEINARGVRLVISHEENDAD